MSRVFFAFLFLTSASVSLGETTMDQARLEGIVKSLADSFGTEYSSELPTYRQR